MARGESIHIGLNSVDPHQCGGWSGDLNACEFDAHDMAAIARDAGYSTSMLLTKEATSQAVLGALRDAAERLSAGDQLLLTYSGHGGQVPDLNADETDPEKQDETWVLYDRQVLDDELYAAYAGFADGVRIAVFSDSCHSGTVTRNGPPQPSGTAAPAAAPLNPGAIGARSRAMPPGVAQRDFLNRREVYAPVSGRPATDPESIGACVVLISGCQDNQLSLDGTHNGLFTATLLTVWNGGLFRGGHRRLRNQTSARMPETQTPNFYVAGTRNREFIDSRPFTINPA
jgi:metacaspase-1